MPETPITESRPWKRATPILILFVLLLAAPALPAQGETDHRHPASKGGENVGLDERLGATVPLDLTFRDEKGEPVTLDELVTMPTIIAPVYYHCVNVCNFLQGGLAKALPEVSLKPGEEFQVISVSFDETEGPELARASQRNYLAAAGGEFPDEAWHFLTGERHAIHRLTDALGYRFERKGEDFLHPVAVAVLSPDGTIVRYLHGTTFLPMDLNLALIEAAEGRVGTTIRKVLQFCFSYDPQGKRYVFNILRVSATVILGTAAIFLAFLLLGGRKRTD